MMTEPIKEGLKQLLSEAQELADEGDQLEENLLLVIQGVTSG